METKMPSNAAAKPRDGSNIEGLRALADIQEGWLEEDRERAGTGVRSTVRRLRPPTRRWDHRHRTAAFNLEYVAVVGGGMHQVQYIEVLLPAEWTWHRCGRAVNRATLVIVAEGGLGEFVVHRLSPCVDGKLDIIGTPDAAFWREVWEAFIN